MLGLVVVTGAFLLGAQIMVSLSFNPSGSKKGGLNWCDSQVVCWYVLHPTRRGVRVSTEGANVSGASLRGRRNETRTSQGQQFLNAPRFDPLAQLSCSDTDTDEF